MIRKFREIVGRFFKIKTIEFNVIIRTILKTKIG